MTEDECAVGRPFEVLIQVPSSDKRAEKAGLVASVYTHSYSGVTEAEGP